MMLIWGDFDWDYGKDYGSYHCCSIRTIVKLFCIGDRNDHYQRNPAHSYGSYHSSFGKTLL